VLLGTSLGTGIAAEMARRGRGARLVLVTPYTSLPDLVTDVAPLVPAGHMLADHFDTLAKSPSIAIPTLVIHGDADEVVPFWMGERVARSIPNARLVRVRGGRHGDLFARERARLLAELSAHSAS
jgi:pimeloyl-ACP methyl ester carboxylesterase